MNLDLRLKKMTIKLTFADGKKADVELREMTGKLRDEYRSLVTPRINVNEKGEPIGFVDMTGLAGELLTRTLFGPEGEPYAKEVVEAWPSRVIDALFVESRKLSALDQEEFNDEGNS